jgi:hypothetical protein
MLYKDFFQNVSVRLTLIRSGHTKTSAGYHHDAVGDPARARQVFPEVDG